MDWKFARSWTLKVVVTWISLYICYFEVLGRYRPITPSIHYLNMENVGLFCWGLGVFAGMVLSRPVNGWGKDDGIREQGSSRLEI